MNLREANITFQDLPLDSKILFLAQLAHELTVQARDNYVVGSDSVADGARLRVINELEHRVTGQLVKLLTRDPQRYPDSEFLAILTEIAQIRESEKALSAAVARALAYISARAL